MGKKGIRGLKARVGRECCISRGEPNGAVEVYKPEESRGSHSVTDKDSAGGRAAKSSEFGEGES